MHKLGLIDSPRCINCNDQIETIIHIILEFPKARAAGISLDLTKETQGLSTFSDFFIDSIVRAKGDASPIALALQADLISRLKATAGKDYQPESLMRKSPKTILHCEELALTLRKKLSELINCDGS